MKIALISCSKTKLSGVHPAKDLYCSTRFKLAWKYAEPRYDEVYILSAKHGLLAPDRRIRAYDLSLNKMPGAARIKWAERVARQVRATISPRAILEFYCGRAYRDPLAEMLEDYQTTTPLLGMNRGEQLQWLSGTVAAGA